MNRDDTSWLVLHTLAQARQNTEAAHRATEAASRAIELAWQAIQETERFQDAPEGSRAALVAELAGNCTLKADNALRELADAHSKLMNARNVALDVVLPRSPDQGRMDWPPAPAPAEGHQDWPGPDSSPSSSDLI